MFKKLRTDAVQTNTLIASRVFNEIISDDVHSNTQHIDIISRDKLLCDNINCSTLIFKICDTKTTTKSQFVSLFALLTITGNDAELTKQNLRVIYSDTDVSKYLAFFLKHHNFQHALPIGVNVRSSPGSTFIVSCIAHGAVKNNSMIQNGEKIYVVIPKQFFFELDKTSSKKNHFYFLLINNMLDDETTPNIYIIKSQYGEYSYVITLVQQLFIRERVQYFDAWLEGKQNIPFGYLTHIGTSSENTLSTGITLNNLEISVIKISDFFVDIHDTISFI